jgi:TrpR-related protein YerC/YecD
MKAPKKQSLRKAKQSEMDLFKALATLQNADEAKRFFQDLCTPTEIQAMADRWQVVASIKAGKPYRQIYEETGVSVTTVGRVARSLSLGEGGYNLIFERLEKNQNDN